MDSDSRERSSSGLWAPVHLQIPADPSMSRVARLAAGGICSLIGLDIEQIEDVKIAVSEVILALIEHGEGHDIFLRFEAFGPSTVPASEAPLVDLATAPPTETGTRFETGTPTLLVTGHTACAVFDVDSTDLELCRAVLAGVSRRYSIDSDGTKAEIRVVLPEARA